MSEDKETIREVAERAKPALDSIKIKEENTRLSTNNITPPKIENRPSSVSMRNKIRLDQRHKRESISETDIIKAMRSRFHYTDGRYIELGSSSNNLNYFLPREPYSGLHEKAHTLESSILWLEMNSISIEGYIDLWVDQENGSPFVRNLFIDKPESIQKPDTTPTSWKSIYYREGDLFRVFQIPPPYTPDNPPLISDVNWQSYVVTSRRLYLEANYERNWVNLIDKLQVTSDPFNPSITDQINCNLTSLNRDSDKVILDYLFHSLKNYGLFDDDYRSGMDYREGEYNYQEPTDGNTFSNDPTKLTNNDPRKWWLDLKMENRQTLQLREDVQNLIALAFEAGSSSNRQKLSTTYAKDLRGSKLFKDGRPRLGSTLKSETENLLEAVEKFHDEIGIESMTEKNVRKYIRDSNNDIWETSLKKTTNVERCERLKGVIRRYKDRL